MTGRRKRPIFAALAVLVAAADYLWALWYYGGLYREGALLSTARVTAENACVLLLQSLVVSLPFMLLVLGALAILRKRFLHVMGVCVEGRRGRVSAGIAAGAYAALLLAGLLFGKNDALSSAYLWLYYLLLVALREEFVFRAVLPALVAHSGLPPWCEWVFPGVLFGCAHTLLPVIMGSGAAEVLVQALSTVTGYTLAACALYKLRLWSGTLWLPVLIHAALDYLGTAF